MGGFDVPQFIGTIGTFLIAFLVLRKFMYQPLIAMIDERQAKLHDDLLSAKKNKEEMERMTLEHDHQLRQAEKKVQEMMHQASQSAQKARDEIVTQARDEAQAILKKSQQQLTEERDKVMKSIREEVITLSIQVAERVVKHTLDKEGQKDLAKKYMADLKK